MNDEQIEIEALEGLMKIRKEVNAKIEEILQSRGQRDGRTTDTPTTT